MSTQNINTTQSSRIGNGRRCNAAITCLAGVEPQVSR